MRAPPPDLRRFFHPYDARIARLFYAARRAVLAAAPTANELIYDAYNAVAAAYSFTRRVSEGFCHVAAYPDHVNLGFNRGAGLADPDRLLAGTGKRIRHIRIDSAADLQRPAVHRLIVAAADDARLASGTVAPAAPARSIVQAISARKRRPSSGTRARR
jgi:hypothetical protein